MTVVVSVVAYFCVYNYPATAEFLSEKERQFIQFRLKNDNDSTREEKFTWSAVLDAFKDPKVWLYGLGFHTMSLPLYTLSLFMVRLSSVSRLIASNRSAHHHPTTGILIRASPAPDHPTLRRGIRALHHRSRPI